MPYKCPAPLQDNQPVDETDRNLISPAVDGWIGIGGIALAGLTVLYVVTHTAIMIVNFIV